jgi:hypothetical protein
MLLGLCLKYLPRYGQQATLGLLQGWLDIGAIGHFIAVVLHLGWTNIAGLLFVNLYFYIFNQQRFRAGRAMNSSPAASPARYVQC